MAISRAGRRAERKPRCRELFGADADVALDLLELLELAWHDCYGDVSPPDDVIADVLLVGGASLPDLIRAVYLAVTDARDLRMQARST